MCARSPISPFTPRSRTVMVGTYSPNLKKRINQSYLQGETMRTAVATPKPPRLCSPSGGVGKSHAMLHLAVDVAFWPLRTRAMPVASWGHGLQSSRTKSNRSEIPRASFACDNFPYPRVHANSEDVVTAPRSVMKSLGTWCPTHL